MVDRKGLEFEAAGPVQGVDALLDIRVHHAAADGWHTSQVLLEIERTARNPEQWMTENAGK